MNNVCYSQLCACLGVDRVVVGWGGRGTMSREVSEPVAFDYISVAEEELLTIISRAQTQPGPIKH